MMLAIASLALLASDHFVDFQKADVHYTKVHYTVDGAATNAETIVQIHGWTCNTTFFRMQTPEFARQYRVITIDLPGHGRSDAPKGIDYTIEHFAAAVTDVLRHAGVEKAVLIGHSMGVPVAMKVLQDNPTIVTGIVAIDGPVWKVRRTTAPTWQREMERNYKSVATRFIESMFVFTTPIFLKAEIRRKMLATPEHVGLNALVVMGDSDVYLKGPAKVPVLAVMAGKRANDDRKQLHQEVFANLRYDVWEEAGHFLMMEQPDRFNKLVLEFVGRLHTVP